MPARRERAAARKSELGLSFCVKGRAVGAISPARQSAFFESDMGGSLDAVLAPIILALDGRGVREADGVGGGAGLRNHPLSHRALRADSSPIKGEQGVR